MIPGDGRCLVTCKFVIAAGDLIPSPGYWPLIGQ